MPIPTALLIRYPAATPRSDYVRPAIKIESGAKSALDPSREVLIKPYVDDDLPALDLTVPAVRTVDPARTSDLAYCEAWARAATNAALPWPAPKGLALKFVAQHLWDPARRETDPAHGMPAEVATALTAAGHLRVKGPHAPAAILNDSPSAISGLDLFSNFWGWF